MVKAIKMSDAQIEMYEKCLTDNQYYIKIAGDLSGICFRDWIVNTKTGQIDLSALPLTQDNILENMRKYVSEYERNTP